MTQTHSQPAEKTFRAAEDIPARLRNTCWGTFLESWGPFRQGWGNISPQLSKHFVTCSWGIFLLAEEVLSHSWGISLHSSETFPHSWETFQHSLGHSNTAEERSHTDEEHSYTAEGRSLTDEELSYTAEEHSSWMRNCSRKAEKELCYYSWGKLGHNWGAFLNRSAEKRSPTDENIFRSTEEASANSWEHSRRTDGHSRTT